MSKEISRMIHYQAIKDYQGSQLAILLICSVVKSGRINAKTSSTFREDRNVMDFLHRMSSVASKSKTDWKGGKQLKVNRK